LNETFDDELLEKVKLHVSAAV